MLVFKYNKGNKGVFGQSLVIVGNIFISLQFKKKNIYIFFTHKCQNNNLHIIHYITKHNKFLFFHFFLTTLLSF